MGERERNRVWRTFLHLLYFSKIVVSNLLENVRTVIVNWDVQCPRLARNEPNSFVRPSVFRPRPPKPTLHRSQSGNATHSQFKWGKTDLFHQRTNKESTQLDESDIRAPSVASRHSSCIETRAVLRTYRNLLKTNHKYEDLGASPHHRRGQEHCRSHPRRPCSPSPGTDLRRRRRRRPHHTASQVQDRQR